MMIYLEFDATKTSVILYDQSKQPFSIVQFRSGSWQDEEIDNIEMLADGWLKGVWCGSKNGCHKSMNNECLTCEHHEKFDSGLTLLFASSCYENLVQVGKHNVVSFISAGAKRKHQWAKDHHVRCLLLEPFLEGNEVEI
jgi:hypothetical protein